MDELSVSRNCFLKMLMWDNIVVSQITGITDKFDFSRVHDLVNITELNKLKNSVFR
jgi:hypothetical protein